MEGKTVGQEVHDGMVVCLYLLVAATVAAVCIVGLLVKLMGG